MENKLLLLVSKNLSRNDTGETHSHQSGISIPKDAARTEIFPHLGIDPRVTVVFYDEDGEQWSFEYIYYNDQFHGKEPGKSHNEFRLTRVIDFLRKVKAHSGDKIWFGLDDMGHRRIGLLKNCTEEYLLRMNRLIKPANQPAAKVDEYEDIDIDDIPILDPDAEVAPTIVKLNKDWMKVEFK